MKPLNTNNPGCDPISSNCVIWQGPDIECINLCKGDTVSTVVNKLALELCNILDTLDISNLDLSCLTLNDCGPEDFQALLQLLIQKVCELENLNPDGGPCDPTVSGGCPDCIVDVAECFYFTDRLGDQQTTMQLVDYVTAIGNRVCQIVGQIETINATLENHEDRITELENQPQPEFTLPLISPSCVLPSDPALPMDQVLIALEQQFCQLQDATGDPTAIYTALLNECSGLAQSSQLNGDGTMSNISGWNSEVSNLAQSITNIWLTLCDIRAAIQSIQATCCTGTACDDLSIAMEVVLTGPDQLTFYFSGTVPAGFIEPGGSTVVVTDALSSSKTITIPVINYLNNPSGYTVSNLAPLNTATNFVAELNFQISDGESECGRVLTDTVINDAACPTVTLTPTSFEIAFSFTYTGGPADITAVLETSGGAPIQTVVFGGASAGFYNGTFNSPSIVPGVNYRVRLEISVSEGAEPTLCPWQPVSTPPAACIPPTAVSATAIKIIG
jgi:hypothetical protein